MLTGEEYDELIMSLVEETLQAPQPDRDKRLRALCRDASVYEEVCRRIEWEQRMGRFLLDPLIERPSLPDPLMPGNQDSSKYMSKRCACMADRA